MAVFATQIERSPESIMVSVRLLHFVLDHHKHSEGCNPTGTDHTFKEK